MNQNPKMRKVLFIAFMIFSLSGNAQYYLSVADKPEYKKYLKYCNDTITVYIIQHGKATVINHNTQGVDYELYKSIWGGYSDNLLKDTVWYQAWKPGLKTPKLTIYPNQIHLTRKISIRVTRRIPSIRDFNENWSKRNGVAGN